MRTGRTGTEGAWQKQELVSKGGTHSHTQLITTAHGQEKTLQAELCEQLTYRSTGEVDPHIRLTVLPKENQAKPEQEALDTPDVLNSDNPHFYIYKKFKEFSQFPRCSSPDYIHVPSFTFTVTAWSLFAK